MKEAFWVECEAYQIKVKTPDVELSEVDITDYIWEQSDHSPMQLGDDFDTYADAYKYAQECAKDDYPTCQKLFNDGYVICGNVYMAERVVVDEEGEIVDYYDCEMITKPYNGKDN